MRLIDATALERKVLEWMPSDPCGREEKEHPFETDIVVSLMMEIEEAPTIENRPQGEWIKSYFTECCGTDENHNPVFKKTPCVKCDQCGEKRRNEEKFCPNCGAKMCKGGESDD